MQTQDYMHDRGTDKLLADAGVKRPLHTPGPWGAETAYATGELVPIENSGRVLAVMATSGDVAYIANALDSDEVQLANARLIAAAPDLLEACESIVRLFDPEKMNDDPYAVLEAMFVKARAAIAKATQP